MPLHVSLLGAQSITEDATGAVRTRSSRTVALVAFLALHAGSPQTRQHIAGLFWPESTDGQALTNLRRELHHLRRTLGGAPCLEVTAKDLCWRDTATTRVDVRTFEVERRAALSADDAESALRHAEAALAEYGGDLLPGLYDDWLLDARAELQAQAVELCALVSGTRAARGDLPGALEAARRRVRMAPLEEEGYRALMEVQADLGDRAGAVSTYHRCASVLERELGVVPDVATRATLQRVMAQHTATDAPRRPAEPATTRPGRTPVGLVGRSTELARLRQVWQTAAAGRPSLAVVRGGAGVGKSRLVAELTALARQSGAVVAGSQCFGTAGRLALAPVADWLRSPAVQSATRALDPVWRDEVDRLVPSGTGRPDTVHGTRAMVDAWQRHRFLEGLARGLLGAGRPTLLVLDNLQWCDLETLAFLTFFLGLSPDAPVLVAATLRADDLDDEPTVADWVVRMRAAGRLTELTLAPLEVADTALLAEAIRGRPLLDGDRDLLQAATGGFPLHVVEAMRTAGGQDGALPAGDLEAVLRGRLDQASSAARELSGLAAAVGRDFPLDLLVEASDLDADSVVHAVDELWRLRIVHERGEGYDFTHDLLRTAAYERVSPPRRWLLHRRLAQGLELMHGEDTGPVSAQLAQQYARGGHPERAVAYYRRAAEVASGLFAHADAIRLHSEALAIVRAQPPGRDRDGQELAVVEAMAAPLNARYGYSSPRLQAVLERAVALAESLGRRDSMLSGLVGLWSSQFVQGRVGDADRTATRALGLVEPRSELGGAAHFACGGSAVCVGKPAEALRHFEIAARVTTGASVSVGTRTDVHGLAWSAHAHWLLGHDELALSSSHEAVRMARSIDHPYSLAVALAYAAITHQLRGDRPALRGAVTELAELCDRFGFSYYREWALVLDGWGRGGGAGTTLARRGIDNLRSEGSFARMPYWLSLLADVLDRTGQHDAARSTLDAATASAQARCDVWWLPEVLRKRAAHDELRPAAVSRLRAAADLATGHGSVALLRRCERDLAERGVRPSLAAVRPAP